MVYELEQHINKFLIGKKFSLIKPRNIAEFNADGEYTCIESFFSFIDMTISVDPVFRYI